MIRTEEWKYVHRYPYGTNEFYDLKNDPGELYNLMTATGMADRAAELKVMLEEWFRQYVDPACDGIYEPVTGEGQIGLVGQRSEGRPAFFKDGPNFGVRSAGLARHTYP